MTKETDNAEKERLFRQIPAYYSKEHLLKVLLNRESQETEGIADYAMLIDEYTRLVPDEKGMGFRNFRDGLLKAQQEMTDRRAMLSQMREYIKHL